MLATDWTIHDSNAAAVSYSTSGADPYGAVDDSQRRLEAFDVSRRFSDEILDFEWVADVQYIDSLRKLAKRVDIHTDSMMMFRNKLE
jgi:hypothetical protein